MKNECVEYFLTVPPNILKWNSGIFVLQCSQQPFSSRWILLSCRDEERWCHVPTFVLTVSSAVGGFDCDGMMMESSSPACLDMNRANASQLHFSRLCLGGEIVQVPTVIVEQVCHALICIPRLESLRNELKQSCIFCTWSLLCFCINFQWILTGNYVSGSDNQACVSVSGQWHTKLFEGCNFRPLSIFFFFLNMCMYTIVYFKVTAKFLSAFCLNMRDQRRMKNKFWILYSRQIQICISETRWENCIQRFGVSTFCPF